MSDSLSSESESDFEPTEVSDAATDQGDTEDDDDISRSEEGSDLPSPGPSIVSSNVAGSSLRVDNAPHGTSTPSSPSIKQSDTPLISPKRKPKVMSAIRKGFNGLKDSMKEKRGLFRFWGMGTKEDKDQYFGREDDRHKERLEAEKDNQERARQAEIDARRESDRLRKRKSRAAKKAAELQDGTRTPGGKKKRVRERVFQEKRRVLTQALGYQCQTCRSIRSENSLFYC